MSDLYSHRKKRAERAGQPDVYQYDQVPHGLRVQIIQIWGDALGRGVRPDRYGLRAASADSNDLWDSVHSRLAREKGVFTLASGDTSFDRCAKYLLSAERADDVLDVIEATFGLLHDFSSLDEYQWRQEARERDLSQRPNDAITELNFRLKEAGLGYQFESGQIVRVDSRYVHAEVVKPALALLSDPRFEGPREEFLRAHELYRTAKPSDHKALEDSVAAALKAFESTIKVICDLKTWTPPPNATAAPLVQLVIEKRLIPVYLKSSLDGLATLSNRSSRHGQGAQVRSMPPYLAAYALHLAATNIVMLVEAFKASGPKP
jgi:AbiJ-like protein/uncharacterized protein DUF7014